MVALGALTPGIDSMIANARIAQQHRIQRLQGKRMIGQQARTLIAIRLFMAAAMAIAAGCNAITASEIPELSERPRWEPLFVAGYKAEAIQDPIRRCMEYPSPPHLDWSKAMIEALCRDEFTQVPQSDTVKAFIDKRDWEGLKTHYDGFIERHYSGKDPERVLYRAFPRYSWRDEADMDGYTKRWLSAQPQSPYANHMRAHYLIWKSWDTRGSGFASQVSPENMRNTVALAREAGLLLRRAIKAEPRLLPAYESLIEASVLGEQRDLLPRILDAAAAQSPDNYYVRSKAANFMQLKWGGLTTDLIVLAADAKAHIDRNPRLGLLLEKNASQLANIRINGEHHGRALKAARKALKYGPDYQALQFAATASDEIGFESETLVYLSQIIRFNRAPKDELMRRGWLWEYNGFYPWALNDYRAALKIAPEDANVKKRIAETEQKAKSAQTSG
jgi:Domain of unknown function (DUF4034)